MEIEREDQPVPETAEEVADRALHLADGIESGEVQLTDPAQRGEAAASLRRTAQIAFEMAAFHGDAELKRRWWESLTPSEKQAERERLRRLIEEAEAGLADGDG